MNLGLLGAFGGLGAGLQTYGAGMVKQQDEIDKETRLDARDMRREDRLDVRDAKKDERSLIHQKDLAKFKDEMEDAKRKRIVGEIEKEAGLLAGNRQTIPPDIAAQGDAAARAYNDSNLSSEDKQAGLLAVSKGVNDNSVKGSPVTDEDRISAAIKLGHTGYAKDVSGIKAKDYANEIKLEIAKGNMQGALERAQLAGDYKVALAEFKAASADGNGKATELMRNWKMLEAKGWSDERIAKNLLEGKVGEYETVITKSLDEKGNEVTTTRKVRAGESSPEKTAPSKTDTLFPVREKKPATSAKPAAEPPASSVSASEDQDAWINRGAPFAGQVYGGGTAMYQEQINKGTGETRRVPLSPLQGLLTPRTTR